MFLKSIIHLNLLCLPPCIVQKYRMEVGTQAMDHLINILQTDRYINDVCVFLFRLASVMLTKKTVLYLLLKKLIIHVIMCESSTKASVLLTLCFFLLIKQV